MSRRKFAPRTIGIIEVRYATGISPVSIAGELGTTVERVQEVIDRIEREKRARPLKRLGGDAA